MTHKKIENILFDRGGRRRIKERRFLVDAKQTPERRTGLKRRSGWARRCRQIHLIKGTNRRVG